MKKLILATAFAAAMCFQALAQTSDNSVPRRKVFEEVWSTVNKTFYDPNFNGVDWQAARDKYAPLAAAAKTDEELYTAINDMLSLLKVSHMQAGSAASVAKRFKQAPGLTGIGLRNVDGRITVYRSLKEFPADKAGIRPGYVITAVDGIAPVDIDAAGKALAGAPGRSIKIRYLDENDAEHEALLTRRGLTDKGRIGSLDIYTLFDAKTLEGGIGYISFSSFVPSLKERLHAAITSMKNAPGMIIDLRGNSGGQDDVALGIADLLFDRPAELMLTKRRGGEDHDYKIKGTAGAYRGKLVILVDEFSGSASEQLTAGLQESGRAYVIGKKTAGSDLDADIKMLPDGGMLLYAHGLPHTPKGVVIEGRGVVPDVDVPLRRSDLLAGRDTQLGAALRYLRK